MEDPDTWEWPEKCGFTRAEEQLAWQWIDEHPTWWRDNIVAYPDARVGLYEYEAAGDELYFITARHGRSVQRLTAEWLQRWYHLRNATVILTKEKGLCCRALGISAFIDDKPEMAVDVRYFSRKTRVYLRSRPHNELARPYLAREGIIVTASVQTFLDHEFQRLRRSVGEPPPVRPEHSNQ